MSDRSVGDTTDPTDAGTATPPNPFQRPETPEFTETAGTFSFEDVLRVLRRPERVVTIDLRGDLAGEERALLEELTTLVNYKGEVNAEASVAEQGRAVAVAERLRQIAAARRKDAWRVKLRGLDSDAYAAFVRRHQPKKSDDRAGWTAYSDKLIAACAVEPELTEDQVRQLRGKLADGQIGALANAAQSACTQDGVDVPKLPGFSQTLLEQGSDER
ncbi:hypothetical protein [Nocardioides massiliensis]|uniref:DUF222 domain-containing protein n=1 Tax=Nocardioides massiliensis TaxID=1325935 RepID=A0ABT9NJ47_9ACTN|nr:hypothetical protein [Nocardioides massiliensis]MDP9820381.1 hypothetical protein [Nocardioides massiliensis]